LGNTLNYLGELATAQVHLEQGIALYDRQQHRTHALLYGQDPGVACRSYAAATLWLLGYPDQALQRRAIPVKRDKLPSIAYSKELIFSMSATLQSTDRRHGIVGQERCHFQCDS